MSRKIKRADVLARLNDIAFGRANDIAKLAFLSGEQQTAELDRLDLTLLSEVKRNSSGAVEFKLLNRTEILKLLLDELDTDRAEGGAQSFFEAMDRAAGEGAAGNG